MPRLGVPELLVILLIVVLIFGVGKLPEVGSSLGRAIREFRDATGEKPGEKDAKAKEETKSEEAKKE